MSVLELIEKHDAYRKTTLNLIASENIMSNTARKALCSDLVHRYSDYDFYGGARYAEELVRVTNELLIEVYDGVYASCEPLSGNLAHIAPLLAFSKSSDKVAVIHPENGGYPFRYQELHREPIYLPFDKDKHNIDAERAIDVIQKEKPKIIFLGASLILFPQPVREISEVAHDIGSIVVYDGSHVMGLIAGNHFQDPLREGADILIGSTHKTLGGPQGGVVIANDDMLGKKIDHILRRPPLLVDNPHLHRIAALAITLLEIKKYGSHYATQIINNSKRLAHELYRRGLSIWGKRLGFTETHQIYWPVKPKEGKRTKATLEKALIVVDALIRIGTQEITRLGMKEREMELVAEAISLAKRGKFNEAKNIVLNLTRRFRTVHYSFDIQPQGGM